jgi:hypothetical protein
MTGRREKYSPEKNFLTINFQNPGMQIERESKEETLFFFRRNFI